MRVTSKKFEPVESSHAFLLPVSSFVQRIHVNRRTRWKEREREGGGGESGSRMPKSKPMAFVKERIFHFHLSCIFALKELLPARLNEYTTAIFSG